MNSIAEGNVGYTSFLLPRRPAPQRWKAVESGYSERVRDTVNTLGMEKERSTVSGKYLAFVIEILQQIWKPELNPENDTPNGFHCYQSCTNIPKTFFKVTSRSVLRWHQCFRVKSLSLSHSKVPVKILEATSRSKFILYSIWFVFHAVHHRVLCTSQEPSWFGASRDLAWNQIETIRKMICVRSFIRRFVWTSLVSIANVKS